MGPPKKLADTVTVMANPLLMASALRVNAGAKQSLIDLESWMVSHQRAGPEAPRALIVALSPALLRFFRSQIAIREQADDLLQEDLDADHHVRHTYRPGEPVLPWMMQSHDGLTSTAIVERGESARTRVRWTRPGPPTRREIYTGALPP